MFGRVCFRGGTAVGGAPPSAPCWRGAHLSFDSSPTSWRTKRNGGHGVERRATGRRSAGVPIVGVVQPWRVPDLGHSSLLWLWREFGIPWVMSGGAWDRSLTGAFGAERARECRENIKIGRGRAFSQAFGGRTRSGVSVSARSSALQASALSAATMAAMICSSVPAKIWT